MADEKKDDLVKIPLSPYNSPGALGIWVTKNTVEWITCRDTFHGRSTGLNDFLFYHKAKTGDNIVNFIKTVEAICSVPEGQELTIKKTSNANVLWIGVSVWWKYYVRRSLLTALLRAGQAFTEDTGPGFLKALNSVDYLRNTKHAVEWFLSGHTACKMRRNNGFGGWYAYFSSKSNDQVEKCLVKLKRHRHKQLEKPTTEEAVK